MLRVTIQSVSNLLKIVNHSAHTYPRIVQPWNLQTLTLHPYLRQLGTRPLQQPLVIIAQRPTHQQKHDAASYLRLVNNQPSTEISREESRMGHIYLYTGNGAGKTANALGLALRSVGHKRKVIIVQFLKWWKNTGEYKIQKILSPYYEIY
jgi:hypothetical protein